MTSVIALDHPFQKLIAFWSTFNYMDIECFEVMYVLFINTLYMLGCICPLWGWSHEFLACCGENRGVCFNRFCNLHFLCRIKTQKMHIQMSSSLIAGLTFLITVLSEQLGALVGKGSTESVFKKHKRLSH